MHVVDALAITGEEGRGSLRKAPGSWQTSFDPGMSEWGNPPLHRWLSIGALSSRDGRGQKHFKSNRAVNLKALCGRVMGDDKSRTESNGSDADW